jgi:hypothetical protein
MMLRILLTHFFCLICMLGLSQVRISGRVYDVSKVRSLEAVTVLTTSGFGTASDSLGRFTIVAADNDSIWFSYLNKPTPKYAVRDIPNRNNFEISLHVESTELKEIRITPPNYRLDSIQNRLDYAKAFNFRKPGIASSLNVGPLGGAGLDVNQLIAMFQFRRNRRMSAFRDRLLQEEEDRYIDHRFNRALVTRLTGLRGESLNVFMERYRPDLEFVETSTDYEFQDYIKKSFSHYQRYLNMMKQLRGE